MSSNRQALISDIQTYHHLLVGSEAYICLDNTNYQTVAGDASTALQSSRVNKPGISEVEVTAWTNCGIVDDITFGEGSKNELKLKRSTKGGTVKNVLKLITDADDEFTLNLSSVIKEFLSIVYGTEINQTGTYTPFQQRMFNGWIKVQMTDEADQLRIGFDLYCSFTIDNIKGKYDEFSKVALKCTVLDSTKNIVYINPVN